MDLRLTTTVEITDASGNLQSYTRSFVTHHQDNPRFWHDHTNAAILNSIDPFVRVVKESNKDGL